VLLEADDFAAGTSSASSKLIHGGLRYLEHGHLGLVARSVRERSLLLRLAPHRVSPLRFMVPLYRSGRWNRILLKCGLSLYDSFAWSAGGSGGRHRRHELAELRSRFPGLRCDGLTGAYSYEDALTDDARLTLEAALGAEEQGAQVWNHTAVQALEPCVEGYFLHGKTGSEGAVAGWRARSVLNAAGPWMPAIEGSHVRQDQLSMSVGAHLVLEELPLSNTAFLLHHPADGRVFFVIPWQGRTLVGTTDDLVSALPEDWRASPRESEYLVSGLRHYFPEVELRIRASFRGVRVLQRQIGQKASNLSREWLASELNPGYFVSVGGKLTTARVDAKDLVNRICRRLGKGRPASSSAPFPWSPPPRADWWPGVQAQLLALGVDQELSQALLRRHGSRVEELLARIAEDPRGGERLVADLPFCRAEIPQALEREKAATWLDLFLRRIPLLKLGAKAPHPDSLGDLLQGLAPDAAPANAL
jgi:glycerol-3-phosphate dehydrogenase